MSALYNRIDFLCKSLNTTVAKVCSEIGIAKSTLSNLKNGRSATLSSNVLQKIAQYLGITVDELLDTNENAPENGSVNDDRNKVVAIFDALPEDKQRDLLRIAEALLPPEAKP